MLNANVSYLVSEIEDRVRSLERTVKFFYKEDVPVEKQVVIKNLPEALKMVKEMNLTSDDEWGGECREAARSAVAKVLKDRMEEKVAFHLASAYRDQVPTEGTAAMSVMC